MKPTSKYHVKKINSQAQLRDRELDTVLDQTSICSATDCTGLIPKGIVDDDEIRSYEELYPYLPFEDEPFEDE